MSTTFAFLTLEPTLTEGYIGAILVTNNDGVPLEFRCTHAVKPTAIQRQLYGGTLQPHIGIELCGKPLLKELRNRPTIIVVKDGFLLGTRTSESEPVVLLTPASGLIETSDSTVQQARIESSLGNFEPLVLFPSPHHQEDIKMASESLQNIRFDPLEPFKRIQTALSTLADKEGAKYG